MTPPRIAYVLLWFPKPSETFIFWEVVNLRRMGLDLRIFTIYGALNRDFSTEMRALAPQVDTGAQRAAIPLEGFPLLVETQAGSGPAALENCLAWEMDPS